MDAPRFHDLSDEWAVPLATALVKDRCSRPVKTADGFLVRCGSRRVAVCPSGAEMVRGDWAAIARSGVFDPPAGKRFRFYLLTLTAPSFGRVHSVPNAAKGHESHRCRCGVRHTEAEAAGVGDGTSSRTMVGGGFRRGSVGEVVARAEALGGQAVTGQDTLSVWPRSGSRPVPGRAALTRSLDPVESI